MDLRGHLLPALPPVHDQHAPTEKDLLFVAGRDKKGLGRVCDHIYCVQKEAESWGKHGSSVFPIVIT